MSKDIPPTRGTIRLDDIVLLENLQVRIKMDNGTVRKYATAYQNGVEFPPIKVVQVEKTPVLVDGWHRVAALRLIGKDRVEAEISQGTMKDAAWFAAEANLQHGLPYKPQEIREVFRVYMKAGKYKDERGRPKSLRTIARDLGGIRSHSTIGQYIKKDYKKIAFRYYSGNEYTGTSNTEIGGMTTEEMLVERTRRALVSALAAFKGIGDTKNRGYVIKRVEEMIEIMKNEGEWQFVVEEEEEDF